MKFVEAVLILSGMIIGVGMFGIPFSFARAGFWLGTFELVALTGVVTLSHLVYAKIILGTLEAHRLPGYINMYLGRRIAVLGYGATLFGIGGTLLAYLLVGSAFLENVFAPWLPAYTYSFWAFLLAFVIAVVTSFSLRREAAVNGICTALLIVFFVFLVAALSPRVDVANFSGISLRHFFLPYGVLLFALSGGAAIPDLIALLNGDRSRAARAIVVGTLLPALLYFFFAYAVVGVGGAGEENAVLGIRGIASPQLVYLGNLIGFLAVFTSYVVTSVNFRSLLMLDLGFPKFLAWLGASSAPPLLYLFGFSHFIAIIGMVGAVSVGIESALLFWTYHAMQKRNGAKPSFFSVAWKCVLAAAVALGALQAAFGVFS